MGYKVDIEGDFQKPGVPVEKVMAYIERLLEEASGEAVGRSQSAGMTRPRIDELRRAQKEMS